MTKRVRKVAYATATVMILVAAVLYFSVKTPPRVVRLLPEADGIVYANLQPVHMFLHGSSEPQHDAEYQQFIDATGIDWERDVDRIAVALHRMKDANGPNGAVAYSMIFAGKWDEKRLVGWLDKNATAQESYAGRTIYAIPSEGRVVRVAVISAGMVVVSNAPTAEQIHSMIDRRMSSWLPFAGPSLLGSYYRDIPTLTLAWGIGQIGLPFTEGGQVGVLGLTLPVKDDSVMIGSLSPEVAKGGVLQARLEIVTASEDAAQHKAAAIATLVTLTRGFTRSGDAGMNQLMQTATVTQSGSRVVITAAADAATLRSKFNAP